jgi:hypothetical protein
MVQGSRPGAGCAYSTKRLHPCWSSTSGISSPRPLLSKALCTSDSGVSAGVPRSRARILAYSPHFRQRTTKKHDRLSVPILEKPCDPRIGQLFEGDARESLKIINLHKGSGLIPRQPRVPGYLLRARGTEQRYTCRKRGPYLGRFSGSFRRSYRWRREPPTSTNGDHRSQFRWVQVTFSGCLWLARGA